MLALEDAKKQIRDNCGNGWLTLVDIVYDNCPEEIIITEVFQKFGALEVKYEGQNKDFEHLISSLRFVSQKICEVCGESGGYTIINDWETTLCKTHYDKSDAKKKYKREA